MCRFLAYLGTPIQLDRLLFEPKHSLVVQGYQPREMTSGLMNADGFGVGWYHPQRQDDPFLYRNTLPIWNDINLPSLSRYVESGCILANVRSATPGLPVDLSNCQPFQWQSILATHNGFIENFRHTLYRPLRDRLNDRLYQAIQGSTDSEHLLGFIVSEWDANPNLPLRKIVQRSVQIVFDLADKYSVSVSANLVISDGTTLVACRASNRSPAPSLYWLQSGEPFPNSVVIASEPLCAGDWRSFSECSILEVGETLELQFQSF